MLSRDQHQWPNAAFVGITTDIEEIASIQKSMDKKSATLIIEKRGVMRGWLKNLFVGQSVLAGMKNILLKSHQIHTERLLLNIARNYLPAPSAPFYTTVLFDVLQILRISHYQSLLNVKVNKPLSHFIAWNEIDAEIFYLFFLFIQTDFSSIVTVIIVRTWTMSLMCIIIYKFELLINENVVTRFSINTILSCIHFDSAIITDIMISKSYESHWNNDDYNE